MELQTRLEDKATVVAISGRLDAVTAPEYEKRIREMIGEDHRYFVVDFEKLEYISSAGLRALLLMAKLLKEKDGNVCFANVTGNVRSVFEMSGFTTLFNMKNSVAEALSTVAE